MRFRGWRLIWAMAMPGLVCLWPSAHAHGQPAPPFSCRGAWDDAETAICTDPRLAELDHLLGARYRFLITHMSRYDAALLRIDQQNFLSERDVTVHENWRLPRPEREMALARLLQARLDFLRSIAPRAPAGITGTWRKQSGQFVVRRQSDSQWRFDAYNAPDPLDPRSTCAAAGPLSQDAEGEWRGHDDDAESDEIRFSHDGTQASLYVYAPRTKPLPYVPPYCGPEGSLIGFYFFVPAP